MRHEKLTYITTGELRAHIAAMLGDLDDGDDVVIRDDTGANIRVKKNVNDKLVQVRYTDRKAGEARRGDAADVSHVRGAFLFALPAARLPALLDGEASGGAMTDPVVACICVWAACSLFMGAAWCVHVGRTNAYDSVSVWVVALQSLAVVLFWPLVALVAAASAVVDFLARRRP